MYGIKRVVLSIEDVLCCRSTEGPRNALFFHRRGAILLQKDIKATHYIFPGVIQFIQLLHLKGIEISFFSSGRSERNIPFAKHLMELALGQNAPESITVKSSEDLQKEGPVKNLELMLQKEETLTQTVLVDNEPSSAQDCQMSSFLRAPRPGFFDQLSEEMEKEQQIECFVVRGGLSCEDDRTWVIQQVMLEEHIALIKLSSYWEIGFLNKKTLEYEQKAIPTDNHKELINKLEETKPPNYFTSDKKEEIYKLVREWDGVTEKAFYPEYNSICYVAGLLFSSIEQAAEKEVNITEILYKKQFTDKKGANAPEATNAKFDHLIRERELYELGKKRLQIVDPTFTFVGPVGYKEALEAPATLEETTCINAALKDQYTLNLSCAYEAQ